jgi:hypothetical protein
VRRDVAHESIERDLAAAERHQSVARGGVSIETDRPQAPRSAERLAEQRVPTVVG